MTAPNPKTDSAKNSEEDEELELLEEEARAGYREASKHLEPIAEDDVRVATLASERKEASSTQNEMVRAGLAHFALIASLTAVAAALIYGFGLLIPYMPRNNPGIFWGVSVLAPFLLARRQITKSWNRFELARTLRWEQKFAMMLPAAETHGTIESYFLARDKDAPARRYWCFVALDFVVVVRAANQSFGLTEDEARSAGKENFRLIHHAERNYLEVQSTGNEVPQREPFIGASALVEKNEGGIFLNGNALNMGEQICFSVDRRRLLGF